MFGCGEARSVPDLARADLAETQMRRQPRGAVAVGPVAVAGIAGNAAAEKRLEGGLCRGLARRPVVAQAAGPIRLARLKLPVLQPVGGEVCHAIQRFRRGQRLGRIAQRQHPPPERCEHAQAPIFLVPNLARRSQEVAREAVRGNAQVGQCGGELIFHRLVGRLRDLVPIDCVSAGLAGQRGDDRGRRSLAQYQRGAPLAQARLQGAQRLRQPPSRRAGWRPNARRLFVEHVNGNN